MVEGGTVSTSDCLTEGRGGKGLIGCSVRGGKTGVFSLRYRAMSCPERGSAQSFRIETSIEMVRWWGGVVAMRGKFSVSLQKGNEEDV